MLISSPGVSEEEKDQGERSHGEPISAGCQVGTLVLTLVLASDFRRCYFDVRGVAV